MNFNLFHSSHVSFRVIIYVKSFYVHVSLGNYFGYDRMYF